jgi:hypothetical protein
MKKIRINLIGFGQDVVIKGDEWYMLSLDLKGLYFNGSVVRKGIDCDYDRSGRLKIVGVDVDGY